MECTAVNSREKYSLKGWSKKMLQPTFQLKWRWHFKWDAFLHIVMQRTGNAVNRSGQSISCRTIGWKRVPCKQQLNISLLSAQNSILAVCCACTLAKNHAASMILSLVASGLNSYVLLDWRKKMAKDECNLRSKESLQKIKTYVKNGNEWIRLRKKLLQVFISQLEQKMLGRALSALRRGETQDTTNTMIYGRGGQFILLGRHFEKAAYSGGPYLLMEIEASLGWS